MIKPQIPSNEAERLRELDGYQLIGIAEDDDYDFITSMAAQICDSKISLITFVLQDKQWFLSHHGFTAREASREHSFCGHAINKPNEIMIVEDARKDIRFWDNPATTDDPHVVFYAGVPLVTPNGHALGTLCVVDDRPKSLTSIQIQQLKKLAKQALNLFELRRSKLELNKSNEELKRNNALFKMAQTANKIGNWELDISSGKVFHSEMIYHIYEIPLNFEFTIDNVIEFYQPEYKAVIKRSIEKCISETEAFDLQCKLITAKGNEKWVRLKGSKQKNILLGSLQDISKEKEAEQNLRVAIKKLQAILDASQQVSIITTDTTGLITQFNTGAERMLGYKSEELLGLYTPVLIHVPEEIEKESLKASSEYNKKIAGFDVFVIEAEMGTPVTKEWTYVRKDGTTFPVLLSINAIVDEGKIIGYLGIAADITRQKTAEENLKLVNKDLESFSYTVAHDLRSPLRAMQGYARMLSQNYEKILDGEAKRIINNITQNASKMERLIDDLLSFSRLGRKELLLTNIDMERLIKEVVSELNKSIAHKADISIGNFPEIMGDDNLLRLVMMNLISNAIKYSSKKENPIIQIYSEVKNGDTIFVVRDNGAGFDMKYSSKLFSVFQRLHAEDEFDGTGIGLATVNRIIVKHGGKIWCEGEVDAGATFYFTLPKKNILNR